MSSAPVTTKFNSLKLTIESGPLKGKSFDFRGEKLAIGRDTDNHLVVADDVKMSRKHAELTFENGAIWIRNLSQKNPVWVDGKEAQAQIVESKQKIQVGETVFTVINGNALAMPATAATAGALKVVPAQAAARVPAAAKSSPAKMVPKPQPVAAQQAVHQAAPRSESQPNLQAAPLPSQGTSSKTNFYVVLGVVALGLIWLLSGGTARLKKNSQLRGRDQVILDLEKSESAVRDIEQKQESAGQQTLQFKTAQEHYIKGFRDYRQGQYGRAMSSFQAALSFYPQHDLAKKYLMLSRRKFDELVQFNMIQGKRYKGKNNFRLCKSAYANVMIMVKDPNDAVYREAKQYYGECSLLLEGKY